MQVRNVHQRDIAMAVEGAGCVLGTLGSGEDRLWPSHRWSPDMRVRFDRPLGVGATGGHGTVPYRVEAYEPGRRLVLGFLPGSGIDGTHRFQLDPVDDRRTSVTHVLEGRTDPLTTVLWPLIRAGHNAYIEDIFDQFQVAAGEEFQPSPQPRWLRLAHALGERRARRRLHAVAPGPAARAAGIGVPVVLAAVGAVHAAWAFGWRWPGGSDQALADLVVGAGSTFPPAWACWAVAGLLGVAAGAVRRTATGGLGRERVVVGLTAAALIGRGLIGLAVDAATSVGTTYAKLDLTLYSPFCLALGTGAGWVVWTNVAGTPLAAAHPADPYDGVAPVAEEFVATS